MGFGQKIESAIDRMLTALTPQWGKHRIGILVTVIFHLLLAISFLGMKISTRSEYYGSSIEMDFQEEETPTPEKELPTEPVLPPDAYREDLESEAIRNFAVDASEKELNADLADEKNIDAEKLYREANQLKEAMEKNRELFEEAQNVIDEAIPNTPQKEIPKEKIGQYKGPTVVSYYLKGRKALRLPVPSYKCEMGGQVVVTITVAANGRVIHASIDKSKSVNDACIANAAIEAALTSRFTASATQKKQQGSITYLFVPQ